MLHTRIKICGITRPDDAHAVVDSGADAIGLVFYAGSPRAVGIDQAEEIVQAVSPFVTVVALFVDEPAAEVERIVQRLSVDVLQFHGDESVEYCRSFHRPWLKALRMRPGVDVSAEAARFKGARGLLLDSWQEGLPGGTGRTFDWQLAAGKGSLPVVLAGGLNSGNVGAAMGQLRPAAVDVSGGVESAPGVKDPLKIKQFVAAVRAADREIYGTNDDQ